jgi:hypothetical protein
MSSRRRNRRSQSSRRSRRIVDFAVTGQVALSTSVVQNFDPVVIPTADLDVGRGVKFVRAEIRIANAAGSQLPFTAQLQVSDPDRFAGPIQFCSAVSNRLTIRAPLGIDPVGFFTFTSSSSTPYLFLQVSNLVLPSAPQTFVYSGRIWLEVMDDLFAAGVAP